MLVLENEWRAKKQDTNQEKDIFQERVLHCRRTLSFYGFIGLSDLLRGGCFGYEPGVWVYNIVCSIHLYWIVEIEYRWFVFNMNYSY